MKNGEIEKNSTDLLQHLWQSRKLSAWDVETEAAALEFARKLVAQAYEEAAQIADQLTSLRGGLESPEYRQGFDTACSRAASDIRALKDSLVSEVVAS